jgi:hypothetical protein
VPTEGRLQPATGECFREHQTKLWGVKVDFAELQTREPRVSAAIDIFANDAELEICLRRNKTWSMREGDSIEEGVSWDFRELFNSLFYR